MKECKRGYSSNYLFYSEAYRYLFNRSAQVEYKARANQLYLRVPGAVHEAEYIGRTTIMLGATTSCATPNLLIPPCQDFFRYKEPVAYDRRALSERGETWDIVA